MPFTSPLKKIKDKNCRDKEDYWDIIKFMTPCFLQCSMETKQMLWVAEQAGLGLGQCGRCTKNLQNLSLERFVFFSLEPM